MYREQNEEKFEAMEQMAIDDNKENGTHREKSWKCYCSDCQAESRKPLISPF